MARVMEVDDPGDPRLRDFLALTDVALRRRTEPAEGLFLGEGELVIRRALRAGYPPRAVLLSPRWLGPMTALLAEHGAGEVPVYVLAEERLAEVTGYHVHRGALASFDRLPLPEAAAVAAPARRLLLLEEVNSHTNIGAVARAAAGLGMDGMLLSPGCADPLYRRAVRVSMGEVLVLPYARLDPWRPGLDSLRRQGFRILALTPGPDATPLDRVRVGAAEKAALLIGAEGPGLSAGALAAADERVAIPMRRGVDSLNVAAAAAVACWELRPR